MALQVTQSIEKQQTQTVIEMQIHIDENVQNLSKTNHYTIFTRILLLVIFGQNKTVILL